jgi:hypothetical protein
MRRFKKSLAAWGVLAAIMSFWGLYWILPQDQLTKVSYSLALGAVFAVLVRYTRDAFFALRDGREGYHFLIAGVYMTFIILFGQRVWAITLDLYGFAIHFLDADDRVGIGVDGPRCRQRKGGERKLAAFGLGAVHCRADLRDQHHDLPDLIGQKSPALVRRG